uniref:Uncharacterized protein n=1 Tax=Amphimedon queenslandica TaxID=400682 RepID=A0A1X7U0X4_AMPQE
MYDNINEGLYIDGKFLRFTQIDIIDTELIGNGGNKITNSLSNPISLSNVTVANSTSTGLTLERSLVTIKNNLIFRNNTGVVGGGLAINDSSILILTPSANLEFIDNHASYKGGGIYVEESTSSDMKLMAPNIPLTLINNSARLFGGDMYGYDRSSADKYQFNLRNSHISSTSDAESMCFCDPLNAPRCYSHEIRTIVIVLHKREVTLHCTNESVRSVSLWYEDPNVEYAKGKHAGLFGFALLVTVFFVIPYTLFLLLNCFFEKYLSNFKVFRKLWSHFKPIIDAYSGPMKDEYRFWPGLLLVARIPVLLSVTLVDSFIQSHSFLLSMLLTVLVIVLSLSHCFGGVYKKRINNVLEVWFLFNLCIMVGLSVAVNEESKVLVWYNTCLSVFIFSFILIVAYHFHLQLSHMKCYDALIKKLFKKQDEDDEPLLDVTEPHKTVDQQKREIVPSSTDVRLSTSRESVVDLF